MRFIFLILCLTFFSFKSYGYTIEQMYKSCKLSQKIAYASDSEKKTFTDNEFITSMICDTHMASLFQSGQENCRIYNHVLKISEDNLSTNALQQAYLTLKGVKDGTSNGEVTLRQAITSFLNFAEKKPDMWQYKTSSLRIMYLGKPFPCILKKP